MMMDSADNWITLGAFALYQGFDFAPFWWASHRAGQGSGMFQKLSGVWVWYKVYGFSSSNRIEADWFS